MPKKPKKSHEESIAENYFPVDKETIESSIEKPVKKVETEFKETISKAVKEIPREEILQGAIEKPFKKIDRRSLEKIETPIETRKSKRTSKKTSKENNIEEIMKKAKKKIARKSAKEKTPKSLTRKDTEVFEPPKIELKKGGYELIITEKPQAAAKIAEALGRASKENFLGVPYYEVSRNGKEIVVGCAVGHLFTLKQNSSGSKVPTFDVKWVPNFMSKKNDFSKKYYNTMLKLAKGAGSITVATDYDVEGELIGFNIVKLICNQNDAKRMKFSTLTKSEISNAYENKLPTIDWGQAIAGETRHHLDWFYGINLSRALMNAIKKTGKFRIMSIGRVQGPALKLIVDKEREIQRFKSEPFWQVFIEVKNKDLKNKKVELKYIKDVFDKSELEKFKDLIGKNAETETKKTEQIIPPNPPFNLTTLQTEAYKFHGITPSNTLKSAQSLYLAGLISYPRTSSQKLPDSIAYKEILKKLSREYEVEHLIKKSKPTEGEKTDPAHPSIYPTGEKSTQVLVGEEAKIYNLIVRRFLSLFCEDAIIDNKKISATTIDDHRHKFTAKGMQIRKKAWMEIYPIKMKEIELPDINGVVEIINSRIEEKETQPPKRYSQASIISELEKRNLGTKATRASILETLYERGYVKEKSIEATSLGISLIETLEKYSPIIVDEELTRSFEEDMERIQESFEKTKTNENLRAKENEIIEKSKETIEKISRNFEENENKIGEELVKANDNLREQQKIEDTLMTCPKCGKGNLIINYSKKTRRHFVSCNAYPDCKTIYSLPPDGTIKKANKNCESCNYPQIMILKKGKRPWILCFNPECETNKSRLEEYRKKQAEKLEKEKSEQ